MTHILDSRANQLRHTSTGFESRNFVLSISRSGFRLARQQLIWLCLSEADSTRLQTRHFSRTFDCGAEDEQSQTDPSCHCCFTCAALGVLVRSRMDSPPRSPQKSPARRAVPVLPPPTFPHLDASSPTSSHHSHSNKRAAKLKRSQAKRQQLRASH